MNFILDPQGFEKNEKKRKQIKEIIDLGNNKKQKQVNCLHSNPKWGYHMGR